MREQAKDKYRNLSEEDKNKKKEYWKSNFHRLSEEKKINRKQYPKNLKFINIIMNKIVSKL